MLPTAKTPPKTTVTDLTVLTYGPTKFGKTSFCAQAESALFLATEAGLNHLEAFQVPISNWEQLLAACAEIAQGQHPFKTVVIDTVDNAYRMCVEHVCAKHKVDHESDLPYGKGYALVANEFQRVLTKLTLLPYGLFLVSHSTEKEVETRTGKVTRVVPTLPEKARKIVLGMADVVLFGDFETCAGPEGRPALRRVLRTKPTAHYDAGDRTGRLPETIDLDYQKFLDAFAGATTAAPPVPESQPAPAAPVAPAARPRTTTK